MQTRRLGGVAVLAVAVLVVSIGTALSRPDVVGLAEAPPIDPPPQVGDCLYAGPEGPFGRPEPDGQYYENPYGHWFSPCQEPWFGEVVAVRSREQISADATAQDDGPGFHDPCATETATFLGRPEFRDPTGIWMATGPASNTMMPNRRQYGAAQMWEACVLTPPWWNADGSPGPSDFTEPPPRTTTSWRGAWADQTFRDQSGSCGDSRRGPEVYPVFCGDPHGTESLGWASWPSGATVEATVDGSSLLDTCTAQAARMVQRSDPTGGGALTIGVWMHDFGGFIRVTPTTELSQDGFAECAIEPAAPDQQLTATVVGLGDGPLPLTTR